MIKPFMEVEAVVLDLFPINQLISKEYLEIQDHLTLGAVLKTQN